MNLKGLKIAVLAFCLFLLLETAHIPWVVAPHPDLFIGFHCPYYLLLSLTQVLSLPLRIMSDPWNHPDFPFLPEEKILRVKTKTPLWQETFQSATISKKCSKSVHCEGTRLPSEFNILHIAVQLLLQSEESEP